MKVMSKQSAGAMLGAALLLSGTAWVIGSDPQRRGDDPLLTANATGVDARDGRNVVAGLGIVEPASGIVNLSALMPGVITAITRTEGERVRRGEILAELVNDDLKAQLAQAESTVRIETARLALIENGPRPEEIAQAEARAREEESNLKLFDAKLERHRVLVRQGAVARETLNETERALSASQERLAALRKQLDILRQGARPEEIEAGRASFKFAQDKLAEARATLDKSYVKSTIDGVVLRRYMEPGEAVTTQTAAVIMQIGDTSRLVVRTQIDENDISDLKVGQKAEITAPSLRGKTLSGTVSRISPRLGAKTITAETPNEKRDTRVLDVIVSLDPGVTVPVNLRVDVLIDLDSSGKSDAGAEPSALRGRVDEPPRLTALKESCHTSGCTGTGDLLDTSVTGALRR